MRAFSAILPGNVSGSARQAMRMGLLQPTDAIVMNRSHLLHVAMETATALADGGYQPPTLARIVAAGPSGKRGMMIGVEAQHAAGAISDTDLAIADTLAGVLSGGTNGDPALPLSEEEMMRLEREALLELGTRPATMARIEHMMNTGKPLRN
jgi:3-hydroxyacyl-CoA dehydrogenase